MMLATIARGDVSRVTDRRRLLVRSPDEWTALWAAHAGPDGAAPAVDFSHSIVAAAFAGERPSAGHSIEIAGALEEDGGLRLVVDERHPSSGVAAAQILTSPFHIVVLPKTEGDVRWMEAPQRQSRVEAGRAHGTRASHVPTATGLKASTAAALAYLAGPFSGAIMLAIEPAHRYVRFHAWQSILAIGGLGLLWALCYALAFASLFFSATTVAALVRVAAGVWILTALVWLYCLWMSWSAHVFSLPLVGRWATKLAQRARQ
jgi:uncharacterized membrane protein